MRHPKFEQSFSGFRERLKGKLPAKVLFIIMGILATVWFLIRVIPKPDRASYPCMRAAFPVMTGFVIWLMSFTGFFAALRSGRKMFQKSRYQTGILLFFIALLSAAIMLDSGSINLFAKNKKSITEVSHPSNEPFGDAIGVVPGRVVWNWNPEATDENCPNTAEDPYVSDDNTRQTIVSEMVSESVAALGNSENLADAWDAIFKNFNLRKHGLESGYSEGEIIFIKINEGTSSWRSNSDLSRRNHSPMSETSPQVTQAVLEQLINVVGVPQENIWVADPRSHVWQSTYEKLSAVFPDVKYGDKLGDYDGTRTLLTPEAEPSMHFSDNGTVMDDGFTDHYYEEMVNADYLINLAALKAHARAGITLTAKNHFGSHTRDGAWHMHPGLIAPENDMVERESYGMYRVLVDIMGSSVLGGNTLFFLVDGLWGGTEATEYPVKWSMAPFNNDWPNSIFVSQDQVALESVCFDFLRNEASVGDDKWKERPNFAQGVDDHLHQAADPEQWPEGITYDPDGDGSSFGSLGVHEHWNNPSQKQYSKNLGMETGIELYSIPSGLVDTKAGLNVVEVSEVPQIDGEHTDACWTTVDWHHLDQMWIPWGVNNYPFEDFHGKFKVMWSEETNMLYFIAKTYDDVFVDNYIYPNSGYHHFDILEVFIDEDQSGGGHIFDTDTENSENAFAYHIAINLPPDGGTTTEAHACDIAGYSWGDMFVADYMNHFGEFIVKRNGFELTWEFSLKLYTDAYDHDDPEASRASLSPGKDIGISLAYCENDTPGTDRDNFFGSVVVTEDAHNNHWMNSDDFGKFKLSGPGMPLNHKPEITAMMADFEFEERDTEQVIIDDLTAYFADEDVNDTISFAISYNADKLELSIEDNMLKGTALPGFRGPTSVDVQAIDTEYAQAHNSFVISAVNHAPATTGSIEDITLEEPVSNMIVHADLNTLFSDEDGDVLEFEAETSDDNLTLTIAYGKMLKLNANDDFRGPATISITASDGLLSVESSFEINSTVGISQNSLESSLKLYPVPAADELNVRFESPFSSQVFVRILSVDGKLVFARHFEKTSNSFAQKIDIDHLSGGNYLIETHHEGAIATKLFTKH
jgi:hypothetical protein